MYEGPETERFAELLDRVGRAMDERVSGTGPDPMTVRDRWAFLTDEPLPTTGAGVDATVDELVASLVPHGARVSDPGFWMFVTSGPTTAPVIAATAAHVAGVQRYMIHAFNAVEERSLQWLAELLGLGPDMRGIYSSGGSTANLVALGAARQQAWESRGVDPSSEGVDGRSCVIYASTEAHHTVQRSAGVLGIGRDNVRVLPADANQRMRAADVAAEIDRDLAAGRIPIAVVANAGTTNTGAIDPLREIGEVAHERGVWFHVDGAYGLPGILDERVAERYDGLDLADSVIVDPHKWLGAPVGIAATFVRDRTVLQRAFTQGPADYLEGSFTPDVEVSVDSMGIPYADFGVELSSPSRGAQVWAILREEGAQGVAARVRRDNDFARFVADSAREHPRLESLTDPVLSIACVRYVGASPGDKADLDRLNARIHRRLVRETPYLPSTTVVNGAFAIRPCFINARTTWEMVRAFVDEIIRIGDEETAD
jgi:aromatic-L-amino-acid/L-tryptophan decarboxylase